MEKLAQFLDGIMILSFSMVTVVTAIKHFFF